MFVAELAPFLEVERAPFFADYTGMIKNPVYDRINGAAKTSEVCGCHVNLTRHPVMSCQQAYPLCNSIRQPTESEGNAYCEQELRHLHVVNLYICSFLGIFP